MSYKTVISGKNRKRRNYSKVQTNVELPNLIDIQTKSFEWYQNEGLKELFREVSPISDYNKKMELYFGDYEFEEPKFSIAESKRRSLDYANAMKINVILIDGDTKEKYDIIPSKDVAMKNEDDTYKVLTSGEFVLKDKETGEIKTPTREKIFLGEYPKMTPWGTFIINGAERVIVTQIIRSAGVYFSKEVDKKNGEIRYAGQIIPTRGAWIEFEIGKKNSWYAKLDRSNRIPLSNFIRAVGINRNPDMVELFGHSEFLDKTFKEDESMGSDQAVALLYQKLRPGEKYTSDGAREYIAARLFENRRYDLANVGRYKVNKKLDIFSRLNALVEKGVYYAGNEDLFMPDEIDSVTGEVLTKGTIVLKRGELITTDKADILYNNRDKLLRVTKSYKKMLVGDSVILETINICKSKLNKKNEFIDKVIHLIGNDPHESVNHITISDILAATGYYMNLYDGVGTVDDIDHLGNRRLRLIGELLQNQFRIGLAKLEKNVRDRMSMNDPHNATPRNLINIRTLTSSLREFYATSQLSQFMDQINPLSELTHKRRISALGSGGLTRERAGFEVRDVHNSHYGRICPIETPEGQNIGLINSLATYARANKYGFIETPYLKVIHKTDANGNDKSIITDDVEYLTADKEEKYYIAQANISVNENREIEDKVVIVRHNGETIEVKKNKVDRIDVAPKQIVAISTACIPFLEHDDANRALMGANMQRQAIPLLQPEAAFVGTGIETKAAHDSGVAVICKADGVVKYVDGLKIIVEGDSGTLETYDLVKYQRSNHSTCVNQKPIVHTGEKVKKSDVLADGSSMDKGEMALGRNVVIAFMEWNGYNYEDAIIMSERLVQDDVYTSIHIEKYEVKVRDTKLGKEDITSELENEKKSAVANLDETGIVRLGAEVKEHDVLVGKVTPKGQSDPTPEERLSHALFSDNSKDVRNTSLTVPHGGGGIVQHIEHFKRKNGDDLDPGVIEVVRVYIAQKRKISEGDKMSGRHGNKGVISKILPQEDMPYLPNGIPIDIMLNPLGIPSRLNIGQVLEVHLGMAAKRLGIHVATPVFDGVTNQDLIEIMKEAGMSPDGKEALVDGRTGRQFDNKINVGVMYMIKLAHMVDDKLHARAEGYYTLVTQQPMGGKAQNGGQRFGEMEVWALEAYGASHVLREMLTIKSDDMIGRNKAYKAIIEGKPISEPGVPEAFRVLVKELQGLGLSVKLIDNKTKEDVANVSLVDEIAASRKEVQ